jgi:putative flippase GtrA
MPTSSAPRPSGPGAPSTALQRIDTPLLPEETAGDDWKPTVRQALKHPWDALMLVVRHWAGLSTLFGTVSTVFDLGLVIVLVQLFHFNAVAAAPLGVFFGSAVNFTLNRLFAFRDSKGHVAFQAMRFIAGTIVAAAVHAGVVYVLTERLHVYYVISKFAADILVFSGGNLLLYRYLVFPKTHDLPS